MVLAFRGSASGILATFSLLLFSFAVTDAFSASSSRIQSASRSAETETVAFSQQKNLDLISSFLDHVKESLLHESEDAKYSFSSLTLRGPSKTALKKQEEDKARGCIRVVSARMIELKKKKKKSNNKMLVLQITFKYHLATDIVKNWDLDQASKGLMVLFGMSEDNDGSLVPPSEWGSPPLAGSVLGIQSACLETTNTVFDLDLQRHKLRKQKSLQEQKALSLNHDRTKQVPLSKDQSFFQALGVTNASGKPKPGMASKYRQCQKFVEILQNLLARQVSSDDPRDIEVVDMGCGRGYLTFALHSYLATAYPEHTITSRGIDVRPKLVTEISGIARSLGESFDGLRFETGSIQDFLGKKELGADASSLQVLIALHACDTATDDALWSGIAKGSDILVVAPCCHKEVRPQLDRMAARAKDHPLVDVLRHNIYRERLAETVTDSLRALLLEIAGYSVQVFEFIGGEHTSKNVMITAVKRKKTPRGAEIANLRHRLQSLASLHGIRQHKLAKFMGETLGEEFEVAPTTKPKLSRNRMPPLVDDED